MCCSGQRVRRDGPDGTVVLALVHAVAAVEIGAAPCHPAVAPIHLVAGLAPDLAHRLATLPGRRRHPGPVLVLENPVLRDKRCQARLLPMKIKNGLR